MNTIEDLFAIKYRKRGLVEVNLVYGKDKNHYTCKIGIRGILSDQSETFTTFIMLPEVKSHRDALSISHQFVRKIRDASDVELLAIWLAYLGKKDTIKRAIALMRECIELEQ